MEFAGVTVHIVVIILCIIYSEPFRYLLLKVFNTNCIFGTVNNTGRYKIIYLRAHSCHLGQII